MKYPTRIYYTEADKGLMWDRWEQGESLNAIARHFGRSHSSIQGILSRTGGIRPPPRTRSPRALTVNCSKTCICRFGADWKCKSKAELFHGSVKSRLSMARKSHCRWGTRISTNADSNFSAAGQSMEQLNIGGTFMHGQTSTKLCLQYNPAIMPGR